MARTWLLNIHILHTFALEFLAVSSSELMMLPLLILYIFWLFGFSTAFSFCHLYFF